MMRSTWPARTTNAVWPRAGISSSNAMSYGSGSDGVPMVLTPSVSAELRDQVLRDQVELPEIVARRAEHHVLAAGRLEILEPRDDVVERAEQVRLLQVLEGAVRAHHRVEHRLLRLQRLGAIGRLDEVREVGVREEDLVVTTPLRAEGGLDLLPVALHPLLVARATRDPRVGLEDALQHGGREHRHVAELGVGHA